MSPFGPASLDAQTSPQNWPQFLPTFRVRQPARLACSQTFAHSLLSLCERRPQASQAMTVVPCWRLIINPRGWMAERPRPVPRSNRGRRRSSAIGPDGPHQRSRLTFREKSKRRLVIAGQRFGSLRHANAGMSTAAPKSQGVRGCPRPGEPGLNRVRHRYRDLRSKLLCPKRVAARDVT